jgi:hypothetical protein
MVFPRSHRTLPRIPTTSVLELWQSKWMQVFFWAPHYTTFGMYPMNCSCGDVAVSLNTCDSFQGNGVWSFAYVTSNLMDSEKIGDKKINAQYHFICQ